MELVCPPWLRVVRSDGRAAMVEDLSLHCARVIDTSVASLLEELHYAVQVTDLTSSEGAALPTNFINELIGAGLLMESRGKSCLPSLLVPFQPTFLSCPSLGADAEVSIIGMPSEAQSVTGAGPAEGPAAIRLASSILNYQMGPTGVPAGFFDYQTETQILAGVSIRDLGDVYLPKGEASNASGLRLSHAVFECRRTESFPLIIGGDHSLTHAAVRGLGEGAVDILHFDAHTDIMETGDHLLPNNGSVMRALLKETFVRRLVTVGVRGVLQVEQRPLREGHSVISTRRVRELGPEGIAGLVSSPCYVSLDIDVLDPIIAPGTNAPVPSGLTMEEVSAILKTVNQRVHVIGADIVEVSPRHDVHMQTSRIAFELALRLLAERFADNRET